MITAEMISHDCRPSYPYLGVYGNENSRKVVLFVEENTGTVVFNGPESTGPNVGVYSTNWMEHSFEPYRDQIVLKNVN